MKKWYNFLHIMDNLEEYLKVAKQAARQAGEVIKRYSKLEYQVFDKGQANNFATEADLESEKTIIGKINKAFPEHNIIAEESGASKKVCEYTWAIDPIDGTIPFTTGFPVYAVSIGLLKDNKPILGIINQVGTSELYWAATGKGAWVNETQIRVGKAKSLSESLVSFDFGHTQRLKKIKDYFDPVVEFVRQPFVINASAVNLAYIARGYFDATAISAYIWDLAAGTVLIEEAGGKVSDYLGNEIDWTNQRINLIASNGLVHDEFMKRLNLK